MRRRGGEALDADAVDSLAEVARGGRGDDRRTVSGEGECGEESHPIDFGGRSQHRSARRSRPIDDSPERRALRR